MSEHKLILEIEVPGFYVDADDLANIAEYGDGDVLAVALEEWMREDVGVTFVSLPGEQCMSSDFEVHAMNGRIVGARISALSAESASPSPAVSVVETEGVARSAQIAETRGGES